MSNATIRVSLPGFDAGTDTNPNHYIFHSDYNTFKILYQGIGTISVGTGSNLYSIPHNAPTIPPCLTIFAKFPDGKVTQLGFSNTDSYNAAFTQLDGHSINQTFWDGTNMQFWIASVGSAYNIPIAWFAYEPPLV